MITQPNTPDGYRLLHEGAIALAEVECNGMCVDEAYLDLAYKQTMERVVVMKDDLVKSEVAKTWRNRFRGKTNFNSTLQLGTILFDVMGYESPGKTKGGKHHQTDEDALETVDDPFVQKFLAVKKLEKAAKTNLLGIKREIINGKIHCFFNLNVARTYRSSSSDFNYQNIPVRDEEISQLIRRCFRARPGNQLVETDYNGAEVRTSACYNKDPRLIDYILDKSKDMHRDMAMELYKLPMKEVTKEIRHRAKNMFVFPQFYGSWFLECAPPLWGESNKLKTTSGLLLRDHLKNVGFKKLGEYEDGMVDPGSFMEHVKKSERDMWDKRFAVYSKWKKSWYAAYQNHGYFHTLSGFTCRGYMTKNEVINYPVQGSAFHCLLWSLIQLVGKHMKRKGMKSMIVGQIHDSIVADVVPSELDDYVTLVRRVMTQLITNVYPWLIVPMEVDFEIAPVGGTWADKAKVEL